MRIFLWEYVTAGGWRETEAGADLIAEGVMMRDALARDLAQLDGVEVVTAQDPGLAATSVLGIATPVAPGDLWGSWRRLCEQCDAVWPIAPETGGLLEKATRLAVSTGAAVLGSRGAALAIAASKCATAAHLAAAGIPMVPTRRLTERAPDAEAGWVVKPDDGAGAADTLLVIDGAALAGRRGSPDAARFVVQPFIAGDALSLSLLVQDGAAWLLTCNRQEVAIVGDAFHYRGSVVGGAESRRDALAPLAARVAAALPELWGYVGIDLVDGPGGPVVIEINPRLTTSYVGLGDSIGRNPAELVLALLDRRLDELAHRLAPNPVSVMVPAP